MSRQLNYVLFSDIKGYSHLSDKQIVRLNNEILPLLNRRIDHIETSYKNTWGDSIVFVSSSVRSICEIGIELRDFFVNFDWENSELPQLQVRSSVHQGENSSLKDPFTGRDTVIGPGVIRAARLEPVTKPNQVWVTKAVAIQIENYESTVFACDPLGDVALPKGMVLRASMPFGGRMNRK
jgi:class 3 adenylate cyclase